MEKQLEFPMDIYPPPLRQIIEDTHRDLNFPVNYIAASLLLAVSVAVGNSRVLKVRDGWRVKPILYMALVGSPGAVKTHPVSFALAPFRRSDDYTLGKYAAELEEYRRQVMTERGEKPKAKQFIVKDSTIEAVAKVLHSNPHGICVHSDELNGWLGSFDKYHRSGGDQEQWLSMFNGDAIVVNRKSQDDIISVPSPFVSVIGSIQPSVLTKCFKGQKVENGFLFRILFVNNSSEGQPMRWPEDDLPSDAEDQWYGFLMSLLETSKAYDETRRPEEYTFNPLAWDIIRTWQNLKEDELAETGEEYQIAIFRKIQDYALRFCLLIHSIRENSKDIPVSSVIDSMTVAKAIRLADYFYNTAVDVYESIQYGGNAEGSRIVMLLDQLPETFTKQQAIQVGDRIGISRSTITRHIRGDNDDPFTVKVKHGVYRKRL